MLSFGAIVVIGLQGKRAVPDALFGMGLGARRQSIGTLQALQRRADWVLERYETLASTAEG